MAGDLRTNRNELFKLVTDAWKEVPTIEGMSVAGPYPLVLAFSDADNKPDNPSNKPWARATMQTTDSQTRGIGARRTEHSGLFIVQCFVRRPNDRSPADNQVQLIADFLTKKFMKHRGNVLLTGIGPIERPIADGFAQCDVRSIFKWDQFVR